MTDYATFAGRRALADAGVDPPTSTASSSRR